MKNKELIQLANISIKSNKKQNKNTIISFTFSMTILILVFFLSFAFYGGIMINVNKYDVISSYQISCSNDKDLNEVRDLINTNDIKEEIQYKSITISYYKEKLSLSSPINYYYPQIVIDNIEYDYRLYTSDTIHIYESTPLLNDEYKFMEKKYNASPIIAGNCFSTNANEIIVSSKFADDLNMNYRDLIGKTISYGLTQATTKYGKDKQEIQVFSDFTIIGVYDERLFLSPSRGEDTTFIPTFLVNTNSSLNFTDYQEEISNCIIEMNNFNVFYSHIKILEEKRIIMSRENRYLFIQECGIVNDYDNYKPLFDFLVKMFSIFGIIILFITIINLFITTSYSYIKSKKYLAMCKAIGMKEKDVKKMFFYECTIVLYKAVITTLIISFVLCLCSTLLINNKLLYSIGMGTIKLSLNFMYFIPIMLIVIVLGVMISLVISWIVYQNSRKEKIIDILNR